MNALCRQPASNIWHVSMEAESAPAATEKVGTRSVRPIFLSASRAFHPSCAPRHLRPFIVGTRRSASLPENAKTALKDANGRHAL